MACCRARRRARLGTNRHRLQRRPTRDPARSTKIRPSSPSPSAAGARAAPGQEGRVVRPRRPCGRHGAPPRRRRRAEGRQRPPRHRDVARAGGLPALPEPHDARPRRPRLARSRPVRALVRALQPHAVHPALPLRLRPRAVATCRRCAPGAASRRVTPRCTTPRASRSPPVRSGRAWPPPSGWPSPSAASAGCSTRAPSPARAPSTTTSTCSPPTATSWRASRHEASALAGHQELGNLTLSTTRTTSPSRTTPTSRSPRTSRPATRPTAGTSAPSTGARTPPTARAVTTYVEDVDALLAAIEAGKKVTDKPTLVVLKTIIAWPAPTKQNTGKSHGSALGDDEIAATKGCSGFAPTRPSPSSPPSSPTPARSSTAARPPTRSGTSGYAAWRKANPDRAALLDRLVDGRPGRARQGPADLPRRTRRACPPGRRPARCSAIADVMPELWGGSADLAESNNTTMEGQPSFIPTGKQTDVEGRPVRPHAALRHPRVRDGLILNGIALEGLTRPYGGTFLVFSDYMRGAVRLAAIQGSPSPSSGRTTRSASARTARPTSRSSTSPRCAPCRASTSCDPPTPTRRPWSGAPSSRTPGPAGPGLTRQNLPIWDRTKYAKASSASKGAYVLVDGDSTARSARRHPRGDRLRGAASPSARERLEKSGSDARRVDAVPGVVREADPVLPGEGLPAGGPGPGQHRGRGRDGLARQRR